MKRCGEKNCEPVFNAFVDLSQIICKKCGFAVMHKNGPDKLSDSKTLLKDWDRAMEVKKGG